MSMREAAVAASAPYDFILSPTSPILPYEAELPAPGNDPHNALPHIAFTVPYNMSEQPAASINWSYSADGLPIGIQLIGRRFDDMGCSIRAWSSASPETERLAELGTSEKAANGRSRERGNPNISKRNWPRLRGGTSHFRGRAPGRAGAGARRGATWSSGTRRDRRAPARRLHHQHFSARQRLEVGAKMHRALQRDDAARARLDADVAEHLLVGGLALARGEHHANARGGAAAQQRHRARASCESP